MADHILKLLQFYQQLGLFSKEILGQATEVLHLILHFLDENGSKWTRDKDRCLKRFNFSKMSQQDFRKVKSDMSKKDKIGILHHCVLKTNQAMTFV